jgi:hypothetical protein
MTQAAILAASGSPGTTTGFKNRIINGNMVINQRAWNGTITADSTYTLDRWVARNDITSKMSVTQSSDAPAGFNYSLLVTSLAATTLTSGGYYFMSQYVEGFNAADLAWGTASAKTVTISFWVKSSLTGTFGGSVLNSGETRCYPFSYTISSANTWEQKSVTILGDTTGTWVGATNGVAMRVSLEVGIGTSLSSPAGAWTSTSSQYGATGATNVLATNGATIQWTGVQLEVGTTATNFDFRSIGTELQLCQRYYWQRTYYYANNSQMGILQAYSASNANGVFMQITNEFRATPTLSRYPAYGDLYMTNANSSGSVTNSSSSYTPSYSAGGIYWDIARNGNGLVAGNAVLLYAPLANATFGLSAEL